MADDGTGQALPTVTGFAAKQAMAVLRKHNSSLAPMLHRAGLPAQAFAAGDGNTTHGRVSAISQAKLLDYAIQLLPAD